MYKKVFIDTNVFISEKFRLSNHKFEKLKKYTEEAQIILLYNEITEKELEVHIKEKIEEGIKSYNKVLKKYPLLEYLGKGVLEELEENKKEKIYLSLKKDLDCFFDDSINLPLKIDIKLVLEDHFNFKLPFTQKKQHEFKDAFVIQMLKNYQKQNNEKVYIISQDKDFKGAFDNDKNFIIFEDLGKFIEKIEIEQLRENEKLLINKIRDGEINEAIEDFIKNYIDLEIDYDSSDYEIDNYEIIGIYSEFIDSFEVENAQKYVFNIKLDMEIEVTYLDEYSSYYDKEDEEYLFSNYVIVKEKHNGEFKLVISVDKKDLKEMNLESELVSDYLIIDQKDTDRVIYLGEHTCKDREILDQTINNF